MAYKNMPFVEFAESYGLIIRSLDVGRWVRVPTTDHPRKKNGAYFYERDFGHVQNWGNMSNCISWRDDREYSPIDRAALDARIESSHKAHAQDRAKAQQQAARKAKDIISKSNLEQHAYLHSKGFPDEQGLVYYPNEKTNLLVIPMRIGSAIVGCQTIDRDGSKKFMFGQRCARAEHRIGNCGVDLWCEGLATGLSINAVMLVLKMPYTIHVCFSASNMEAMAKASKSGFVIADNDASGTGERVAKETGLPYFMPEIVGQDFNDIHKEFGLFKASQILRNGLMLADIEKRRAI